MRDDDDPATEGEYAKYANCLLFFWKLF